MWGTQPAGGFFLSYPVASGPGLWPWEDRLPQFNINEPHCEEGLLSFQPARLQRLVLRHSLLWSNWRMEFAPPPNLCAICSELKTNVSGYNYHCFVSRLGSHSRCQRHQSIFFVSSLRPHARRFRGHLCHKGSPLIQYQDSFAVSISSLNFSGPS